MRTNIFRLNDGPQVFPLLETVVALDGDEARDVTQLRLSLSSTIADHDPTSRVMLGILAVEEDHADEMHDLLVAHEGTPILADE